MKPTFTSFLVFLLLMLGGLELTAQQIVWASRVVAVSSDINQSAPYILGEPDVYSSQNQDLAWSPKKTNAQRGEFIHVQFDQPIRTRQVAIMESANPGAIERLTAFFPDGTSQVVYHNKYPRAILTTHRLFTYGFPLTAQKVVSLKIELNTRVVNGFNRIDAVAISDQIDEIIFDTDPVSNDAGNMGEEVNSEYAETQPQISADGKVLYFVRKNHPKNMGDSDIWVSYRQDDIWSTAVNMGSPINNRQPNAVLKTAADNRQLYLKSGHQPEQNSHIFFSQKTGRKWDRPKRLNIPLPTDSSISDYHITNDGQTILIAIETADNGFDLKVTELKNGNWSSLEPLGKIINSSKNESSLFLLADEKTLFFSSDRNGGFGKQDMWVSTRQDDSWTNWSAPINLGNEINNKKDNHHFSFTKNGQSAFYSQRNTAGDFDIYEIEMPSSLLPNADFASKTGDLSDKNSADTFQEQPVRTPVYAPKPIASDVVIKGGAVNTSSQLSKINLRLTDLENDRQELANQKIQRTVFSEDLIDDKKMEVLKDRYIQEEKDNQFIEKKSPAATDSATEDPELAELKRRFNKYNQQEKSTQNDEEYMEMELSDGTVYDHDHDKKIHGDGFIALRDKVWNALEESYAPIVKWNIKKQIFSQVEKDLLKSLTNEMEMSLAQQGRFRQEGILLYREIKKSLRKVESNKVVLKNIPENDISFELRKILEPEVRKQLYANQRELAAEELRIELYRRFLEGEQRALEN